MLYDSHSDPIAPAIFGAAVIDDILALIMLAIVSGIVVTGSVELGEVGHTMALACLFILSALSVRLCPPGINQSQILHKVEIG